MALIRCKECGRKISDQVERCPKCGFPVTQSIIFNDSKNIEKKRIVRYFLLIGAIVFSINLFTNNKKEFTPQKDAPRNQVAFTQHNKNNGYSFVESKKSDKDIFLDSPFLSSEEIRIRNFMLDDDLEGYKKGKKNLIEDAFKEKYTQTKGTTIYKDYDNNEVYADEKYQNKEFMVYGAINSVDKDFLGNAILRLNGDGYFGHVIANFGKSPKAIGALSNIKKGSIQSMICSVKGKIAGLVYLDNCRMAADVAEETTINWKNFNPTNREVIGFIKTNKEKTDQGAVSEKNSEISLSIYVKIISIATSECKEYKDDIQGCFTKGLKKLSDNSIKDDFKNYFISHGISEEELHSS